MSAIGIASTLKAKELKTAYILGGIIEIYATRWNVEDAGMATPSPFPSKCPIWHMQRADGFSRMTVDYRKLNQMVASVTADVPDAVSFFKHINTSPSAH